MIKDLQFKIQNPKHVKFSKILNDVDRINIKNWLQDVNLNLDDSVCKFRATEHGFEAGQF